MNYRELRNWLLNYFDSNSFRELTIINRENRENIRRRLVNLEQKVVQVPTVFGNNITIAFPGYKAKIEENGKIVFDYRVDFNGIAISHANIAVDLYNKAVQAPDLTDDLIRFLIDLSINGQNINLNDYIELCRREFSNPSNELINIIDYEHRRINKNYDSNANLMNYSIQELVDIIPYIVLQEDINYPMPRLQGRRMSFYRYIESVLCANDNGHNIEEIVKRIFCIGGIPRIWREYIDIYQQIERIANI